MPLYEFTCTWIDCGHVFESVEKVGTKRTDCPKCERKDIAERFGVELTGGHTWGCSSDGAMPKRGR
jgi:putative FmdB family regulatory protein